MLNTTHDDRITAFNLANINTFVLLFVWFFNFSYIVELLLFLISNYSKISNLINNQNTKLLLYILYYYLQLYLNEYILFNL